MTPRVEIRRAIEDVRRLNSPAARLTGLGMHYIAIDGSPVLVTVEINVSRLLAVLNRRLVASKRGVATTAKGAVRVSIATPEGRELAAQAQA